MNPLQRLIELEHDIAKSRRQVEWDRLKDDTVNDELTIACWTEMEEEKIVLIKEIIAKLEIADEIIELKGTGVYDSLIMNAKIKTRIDILNKLEKQKK